MNCKYCRANCTGAKQDREIALCLGYDPPQTNADRIRAMTDEDLAEFLNTVNTEFCSSVMGKSPCRAENCPCWLEWLKEEATDVN